MVTLSSAIQMLRDELTLATRATIGNEAVRLTVEEAEVELQVTLGKELNGSAEVNVWVVKVGGGGGGTSSDSHVVRLRLKATSATGGPVDVSSRTQLPSPPPGAGHDR